MQFLVQLIQIALTCIFACLTYRMSLLLKNIAGGSFDGLFWLLEKTPALDARLFCCLQAVVIASTVCGFFGRISNHIILTLDILYRSSLLLLILYHSFKEFDNSPSMNVV